MPFSTTFDASVRNAGRSQHPCSRAPHSRRHAPNRIVPSRLDARSRIEAAPGGGRGAAANRERRTPAYVHPLHAFGDLAAFDLKTTLRCRCDRQATVDSQCAACASPGRWPTLPRHNDPAARLAVHRAARAVDLRAWTGRLAPTGALAGDARPAPRRAAARSVPDVPRRRPYRVHRLAAQLWLPGTLHDPHVRLGRITLGLFP